MSIEFNGQTNLSISQMKQLIIFALVAILSLSCNRNGTTQSIGIDDFYTRNAGWDYKRIPLVEPFELTNLKGNNYWSINSFKWEYPQGDIMPVDSIQCSNSIIVGHAAEYIDPENDKFNTPELWFMIDFKTKQIQSFINRNEIMNIEEFDALMPVDSVYSLFLRERVLPWFPDSISLGIKDLHKY